MPVLTAPLADVLSAFEDSLSQLIALIGALPPSSRFCRYRALLHDIVTRGIPQGWLYDDDSPEALTLWESLGQALQLRLSSSIWAKLDQDLLAQKLREIVRGPILPSAKNDPDPARDTILELTTAALLTSQGFDIQITPDEDLVAEAPAISATLAPVAPFAVECKRPSSVRALDGTVRSLRAQLARRYEKGRTHGIAVIGADRLSAPFRRRTFVDTHPELEAGMNVEMERVLAAVADICARGRRRRFDFRTSLGLVSYTCVAMVENPESFSAVARLLAFPIGTDAASVLHLFAREPVVPLRTLTR